MEIKKISDLKNTNMLVTVYGNSGAGKTQFASTFPKPLLLIDCGDRKYSHIEQKGIFVANAETYADVIGILKNKKATDQFKTIVVDNLTGLMSYARKSHAGSKKTLTQQDWQNVNYLLVECVEQLKKLSQERICVLVGHQKIYEAKDGDDSVIDSITIKSNPALRDWIEPNTNVAVYVKKFVKEADVDDVESQDEVAFGAVVSPQLYCWTNGQGLKNVPQGMIENPSYDKIFNHKGDK